MRSPKLTRAEDDLLELLASLVTQYGQTRFPAPDVTPGEMITHLIESRGVTKAEGKPDLHSRAVCSRIPSRRGLEYNAALPAVVYRSRKNEANFAVGERTHQAAQGRRASEVCVPAQSIGTRSIKDLDHRRY